MLGKSLGNISKVLALGVVASLSIAYAPVAASATAPGAQGQATADHAGGVMGGWDSTTEGIAGRPYVEALTIDGVDQLSHAPTSPTDDAWLGPVRAVVYAFNTCPTGVSPSSGQCYADPNRIGITLGYGDNNSIGTDFADPSATSYGITTASVIDVTVQMNTFKNSLGWTWLNGTPSFWQVDTSTGLVHLKFHPAFMPSSVGLDSHCTTIPVSTCSTPQADSEVLSANLVLSVDNTNSVFRNSLFATEAAIMGSVELGGPIDPNNPAATQLTYGLAAPHSFASSYTPAGGATPGGTRRGALYGLLPNSLLTTDFGLTDPTQVSSLMSVLRTTSDAAPGADAVSWSAWNAADNGTDGQLVTISNISFSSPRFAVGLKSGVGAGGGSGEVYKKGMKKGASALLSSLKLKLAKGEKVKLAVAKSSAKVCSVSGSYIKVIQPGKCSYTVTVLSSKGKAVKGKTKSSNFTTR